MESKGCERVLSDAQWAALEPLVMMVRPSGKTPHEERRRRPWIEQIPLNFLSSEDEHDRCSRLVFVTRHASVHSLSSVSMEQSQ